MTSTPRFPSTALAAVACLALGASGAHADWVYLDAADDVGGNTTLADGSTLDAADGTGGTTWRQRDNAVFGSSDSVFEGVEPSPVIKTTIAGLTPGGSYAVNVNFWDPQSEFEDWNVSAGFSEGSLVNYAREADAAQVGSVASVLASTLTYDVAPTQFGPNSGRELLAGYLGVTTADASGEIEVYVDDIGSGDVNLRAWYDGVSYQVIPEPTAVALAGLATLVGARRRV